MTGQQLISLLGKSVHHPEFRPIFSELAVPVPAAKEEHWGLKIDKLWNEELGVYLDFTTIFGMKNSNDLEPDELFTKQKYELILSEVNFHKAKGQGIEWPFGLVYGDSYEVVVSKLGTKPSVKRKNKGSAVYAAHNHYYYTEHLSMYTHLNEALQLTNFNVQLLRKEDRKYLLKKAAGKQKETVTDQNLTALQQIRTATPVNEWRARMQDGDDQFNEKNLEASNHAISTFIDELIAAATAKKSSKVKAAIKKVVTAFNKLNLRYNYFVETMEREELAMFIEKAVRLTGYTILEGEDLTQEWREW